MKKSYLLFLTAIVIQTCGIFGFPMVSAASHAEIGKPILQSFICISLLLVLFQMAKQIEFGEMINLAISLSALAVCTHQLLGYLVYPGLLKDVDWMSTEHMWLTLMVFVLVIVGYIAVYGFFRLFRWLLHVVW